MKKLLIPMALLATLFLGGCEQGLTKNYGGRMEIQLEPGVKLETITWKDDSLWYLTRPIKDGESPETHTFQQSSEFGVFEGTVVIIESEAVN